MSGGVIYYTDNIIDEPLCMLVRKHIAESGLPIVSASLNEPIEFGDNAVIEGERSYPTMVKQIISCLERSTTDYVFFCEHDVLYSRSHFDFIPPRDNIFFYDDNVWRWWLGQDKAIRHDRMLSLSSLCVNRKFALDHHRRRLQRIKDKGWDKITSGEPMWARIMGYEPGTKTVKRGGFSDDEFATWGAAYPSIDIRHKGTFSNPKTKLEHFTHKPKWFKEIKIDKIEGWNLKELFNYGTKYHNTK